MTTEDAVASVKHLSISTASTIVAGVDVHVVRLHLCSDLLHDLIMLSFSTELALWTVSTSRLSLVLFAL